MARSGDRPYPHGWKGRPPRRPPLEHDPEVVRAYANDQELADRGLDDGDPPAVPAQRRAPRPTPAKAARPRRSPRAAARNVRARTVAPLRLDTDATGFVLALMFWGWVVLPMLRADSPAAMPAAVGNVLRAKFFNKGPDGAWLP